MKVIPLGLQCSVPEGIKRAKMREYSYPFDWLWSPSKTTYTILSIVLRDGIDHAVEYMTTGYSYYKFLGNEHYRSVAHVTESQMNKESGLGITHFTINNEYKAKLRIRLERFLRDVRSGEQIVFVYADAANAYLNYHLDDIVYGVDATEYLLRIHELMYPLNPNIQIVYFCWQQRRRENGIIEYVPYDFKKHWYDVSDVIKTYLIALKGRSV